MKRKIKTLFFLFFLLSLCWLLITGCHLIKCHPSPGEKPVTVLTNANGEPADEFTVLDSVFGSFSGLLPNTRYTIQVIRSDEKKITPETKPLNSGLLTRPLIP